MADEDDLEFPRWEHHSDFKSELVENEDQRAALLERWGRGEGKPKGRQPAPVVIRPPALVPPVVPPKVDPPAPQFTVYSLIEDKDVPLTQARLDELLLGDEVLSILWPAVRRDLEADPSLAFPPETAEAIDKVKAIIEASASEVADDATEILSTETAPAKRGPGRPRKQKTEA